MKVLFSAVPAVALVIGIFQGIHFLGKGDQ